MTLLEFVIPKDNRRMIYTNLFLKGMKPEGKCGNNTFMECFFNVSRPKGSWLSALPWISPRLEGIPFPTVPMAKIEMEYKGKSRIFHLLNTPNDRMMLAIHRLQKFLIVLGAPNFVHEKLHRFHGSKRAENLSQDPHLI
jgi:hypothetical protein